MDRIGFFFLKLARLAFAWHGCWFKMPDIELTSDILYIRGAEYDNAIRGVK